MRPRRPTLGQQTALRHLHRAPRQRRRRLVVGPVGAALERTLGNPRMPQKVANYLDVAWLAVVGGGHDRDVLRLQVKTGHDAGAQRGDGLKWFRTGAEVGE